MFNIFEYKWFTFEKRPLAISYSNHQTENFVTKIISKTINSLMEHTIYET